MTGQLDGSVRITASNRLLSASHYVLVVQVLLFVSSLLLLWSTTQSLMAVWGDDDGGHTYSHGYLILAICFWLLWRERNSIIDTSRPSLLAGILLAAASVAWLVCVRAGIQTLHQLALPVMIWLAVWTALGIAMARRCAFAIGYLFFAIPVWGSANGLLQDITVRVTDAALSATGITAYVTGNMVHLSSGVFEIAGGCSGLHFFIVALALAALYGEINRDTCKVRFQLLALAAGLALLTNWLRVYIIIVAGYLTDMQHYLVRVEHYRFGWLVFAVAIVGFFLIARRLPLALEATASSRNAPSRDASSSGVKVSAALVAGIAMSVAATAVGPLWQSMAPVAAAQIPASALPANPGAWSGPAVAAQGSWSPEFIGADVTQLAEYSQGQQRVQAFTALYASQAQGKELIGYGNTLLGQQAVTVTAESNIEAGGSANELLFEQAGEPWVLWYFYQVDALRTNRPFAAQAWYGITSLVKDPVSRVVAVRAPCAPDCDAARVQLQDLLASMSF